MVVSHSVTELTSNAILAWTDEQAIKWHNIAPGKPMQNATIGGFYGRLRDEKLNETMLTISYQTRCELAIWGNDYNTKCPHSGLGWPTPFEFARTTTTEQAMAVGAAPIEGLRTRGHCIIRSTGHIQPSERTQSWIEV